MPSRVHVHVALEDCAVRYQDPRRLDVADGAPAPGLTLTLSSTGATAVTDASGLARFAHLTPKPAYLGAFLIMAALTLACAFCRLRFPWWPIHPIAFVFLNSHQAQMLYFSFFLGWMIKSAVTRYGGSRMYQQFKPVMVGLVAGEVLAGLIPLIVGLIYYLITGLRAPGYFTMT